MMEARANGGKRKLNQRGGKAEEDAEEDEMEGQRRREEE